MSFLVLLLVLVAERFSGLRRAVQHDGGWQDLRRRHARAAQPWTSLAWLVLLPLLLVALLLQVLEPMFYGWLALPVHLLLVLYSLGRDDPRQRLQGFHDAWARDDREAAALIAERDLGVSASEPAELLRRVQGWLAWEAFQAFFVVVFWYLLLGPLPALAYRLLRLAEDTPEAPPVRERAAQLRHALDWVPARLLVLSFGLVGQFAVVQRVLLPRLWQWDEPAAGLLGEAASQVVTPPAAPSAAEGPAALEATWALLFRAGMLWYVVIALAVLLA